MDSLHSLTDQQRNILEQYQSRTYSADVALSIRILRENNWDIELAEQNSHQNMDSQIYSTHNEQDSPSSTSALLGNRGSTSTRSPNKGFFWVFVWPFSWVYRTTVSLFQFAARLLYRPSITPPRRDARTEADRFLRDFESTYGTTHPTFFNEGGYTQALKAAKNDLKYLLVILCSEEHDDNDKFCRETLTDVELLDFLHHHQVLTWGGNIRYTEAFQVSNTLQATTYPFLAIIALQQTAGSHKMSVIDRIEGPVSASSIIRRFNSVIARIGHSLDDLRAERARQEYERRLRQEQEQAYRESLKADQRKQELQERMKHAALKAKQAKAEYQNKRKQFIQYLCHHVLNKQVPQDAKTTKISFRLSNGDRVIRQFNGEDTLVSLYEYIEAYSHKNDLAIDEDQDVALPENYTHQYKFTMHSPFPKTVIHPDSSKKIADEKGLWPSATLIVDVNEEDNEEEGGQETDQEEEL